MAARWALAVAVMAVWPALAQTAAWRADEDSNGVATATVTTDAVLGEHAAPVAVRFQCEPGKDGTLSILLIVRDTRFVPYFPFDAFEGPDAATGDRPLFRVEVGGATIGFGFDLSVTARHLDPTTFVFAHGEANRSGGQVARIADAIRQGATIMTVGVAVPDGSDRWLLAKVPLTDAATAVSRATEGCR